MDPFQEWLHCWSLFFDGRDMQDVELWGLTVPWWGRLGILMSFYAGLIVIFDIVSPDSVDALEDRARRGIRSAPDVIAKLFAAVLILTVLGLAVWAASKHPFDPMAGGFAVNADDASTNPWFLLAIVIYGAVAVGIWKGVARMLSWMVEHNGVRRAASTLSLVLFVVGFHFEMLAS